MNDKVIQFPSREEMAEEERQVNKLLLESQRLLLQAEIIMAIGEAGQRKNNLMKDADILNVVMSILQEMMVNGGMDKRRAKAAIVHYALKLEPQK
jgi:hypothetical protein